MINRPCNEDRVIEYVRGRFSAEHAEQFQRHLKFCRGCRDAVLEWERLHSAVRAELTDPIAPAQTPLPSSSLAAFRERVRRAEQRVAKIVDDLLQSPASTWERATLADDRFVTPAAVRTLLERAADAFDATPTRCREICARAARLADVISESRPIPVPELRVAAYKDLANVSRRLGDYDEAYRCLGIADLAAADTVEPEYQHAVVAFARAILLTDQQRWSDALRVLLQAREVFGEADRRRFILTFHQESVIKSLSGDSTGAAATIADIIDQVSSWGDHRELARLYTVASFAWEGAGDLAAATDYLRKAAELHERTGDKVEIAMDDWRLASLLAKAERYDDAYIHFSAARKQLDALNLRKDILNLDFDVLEAKISEGRIHPDEIVRLCRRIAATSVDLPVNAAHALAWLRQAAPRIDRAAAQQIRAFVKDSQVYRYVEFIPPFDADQFSGSTVGTEA